MYLCNYPLLSAISSPLATRTRIRDNILPRSCEPRERERGGGEGKLRMTKTRDRDTDQSRTRQPRSGALLMRLQIQTWSVHLQMKFNCCGGVMLCCCSVWLCCGRVSSLYCIDCLEAEDRSQASPPAAHCSQFSVQKTRSIRFYLLCIIVEMSSFRIVIKLCIKYNVTIIAPDNTCITSDNIETKRNCHLTRNLNIENIGMFCN